MYGSWFSDSPTLVWQVSDSLSEQIRTSGGSHHGCTVLAGEFVSTCQTFDFWLCKPQGERKSWQWTRQTIRYAPGNVPGSQFGRRCVPKEVAEFSILKYLEPMPLTFDGPVMKSFGCSSYSGSSYRAAGSDHGKHLEWWDRHQELDRRAGTSGGSCCRRVYQQCGPWITATGTPRQEWSTGRRGLAFLCANCLESRLLDIPPYHSIYI